MGGTVGFGSSGRGNAGRADIDSHKQRDGRLAIDLFDWGNDAGWIRVGGRFRQVHGGGG